MRKFLSEVWTYVVGGVAFGFFFAADWDLIAPLFHWSYMTVSGLFGFLLLFSGLMMFRWLMQEAK